MDAAFDATEYVTLVFDDETEYVRFVNHVFDRFKGWGLSFTNQPIVTSVRVTSWLLEQTQDEFAFAMRRLTEADRLGAWLGIPQGSPFDPADLEDFRVPGLPTP
jgi:hypothetical protein